MWRRTPSDASAGHTSPLIGSSGRERLEICEHVWSGGKGEKITIQYTE